MNKLDLLILAGAGAMAAAAPGLWFSREQVITLRPMERSSDMPVFQPVDEEAHAAERRRIAVVVPRPDDDPVDVAFLKAAKRLRNSPCSEAAKADYLAQMTVFARNNLRNNLAAARAGDEPRPSLSPLAHQASEYLDHMQMYGFVTSAEYREALKGVSANMALSITANEEAGRVMDMEMDGNACDRRRRGEPQPPMSWEPQGDERG